MAQCMGSVFWLHAGHYQQFTQFNIHNSIHTLSSITVRSFLSRTVWEDVISPKSIPDSTSPDKASGLASTCPSITCFRDDDLPLPEHFLDKDGSICSLRSKLEISYSPWAMNMMKGFGRMNKGRLKEFTGGPTGGGNGKGDDGGGDGGGGGGDEDGDEHLFILPLLTIAFAAFHLGYCIAIWMKDQTLDFDFMRTGLGLFCLLAVAAIRMNNRTGIDAYILGLGASVGVMIWTGERCLIKKEGSPAGVVALFAASMAVMFTAALYHNV